MGHIDHRRAQIAMQTRDLDPGLHAQGGVKVRQRLVEQNSLGVLTMARPMATRWRCPPDSSMAAAPSAHPAPAWPRRGRSPARSGLGHPRLFQRQPHIVAHAQMRVKRIALKHHGNRAGPGQVVDADPCPVPPRPRSHPQARRSSAKAWIAAARGADKDAELASSTFRSTPLMTSVCRMTW